MKKIAFVTLFPEWIRESLSHSMMARAEASGSVEFSVVNPRSYCYDSHRKVDDIPYGGHPGMLMKAEPVALAIESLVEMIQPPPSRDKVTASHLPLLGEGLVRDNLGSDHLITSGKVRSDFEVESKVTLPDGGVGKRGTSEPVGVDSHKTAIVITEPSGTKFEQPQAEELASYDQIIFVCGHYEGIDHRIEETFATHVFSIGDYVLTNGELPALVMTDAVVRLLPGVLGNQDSLAEESFQNDLLGAPNYTRPDIWREKSIPDVLKSGNHAQIDRWRSEQARERTRRFRPDLLDKKGGYKGN
ncbi:MAG: tRNA (guanosine(37)-N1)-methyltransferase TrmD [Armatimonadota bacterium]